MASAKPALSSRLAIMGFMKRAAAGGGSKPTAADEPAGQQAHAEDPESQQGAPHQSEATTAAAPEHGTNDRQLLSGNKQPPKYALSEKLTNMKFMQRGQQHKRGFEEAIGQDDSAKRDAEWVAAGTASSSGCTVIQERDPLPLGICGRMSFGQFNPAVEQLQAEALAIAEGKPLPRQQQRDSEGRLLSDETGVSVTADDMARGWGKGNSVLSSLRMERTNKKARRH